MAPTARPAQPAEIRHIDPFSEWLASFERSLLAENRSPNTVRMYRWALLGLRSWLTEHGRPTDPVQVTRDDLRGWMADGLQVRAEASMAGAFAAVARFFRWLSEEEPDLLPHSPAERLHAPRIHEKPADLLSVDEIKAMLKVCAGAEFEQRRDTLLIRLGYDAGLRRSEFSWLSLEDVDLDNRVLLVRGKGGHLNPVYIGAKTAQSLDRYLRVRARHPHADLVVERVGVGGQLQRVHPLFLSPRGALVGDSIYELFQRRGRQAGIARPIHPHMLRHAFADSLKASDASDELVMRLGRWKDARVMRRYASSAADRRAQEAHARLSPGDRV